MGMQEPAKSQTAPTLDKYLYGGRDNPTEIYLPEDVQQRKSNLFRDCCMALTLHYPPLQLEQQLPEEVVCKN